MSIAESKHGVRVELETRERQAAEACAVSVSADEADWKALFDAVVHAGMANAYRRARESMEGAAS